MPLSVALLDTALHDRSAFDCGNEALNAYLRTRAVKHQRQRIARVFVLVDGCEPSRIRGFYALSNSHIARADLSASEARKLPLHPVPTVTLGRLAVDRRCVGRGFGTLLLIDAIKRCALVGEQTGVWMPKIGGQRLSTNDSVSVKSAAIDASSISRSRPHSGRSQREMNTIPPPPRSSAGGPVRRTSSPPPAGTCAVAR